MVRPRVGISSCLLGERVRYDGDHRRDDFIHDVLGPHVEWVPFCPEVAVGMGVPREPVRLEGDPASPRMIGLSTRADWTQRMRALAAERAEVAARSGLHGYVLKARSPSCGIRSVPVHAPGAVVGGRGLFADALARRLPLLPLADEDDLADAAARDHFCERVFAHARWTWFRSAPAAARDLRAFHTLHAEQLAAHDPEQAAELGRLDDLDAYERLFMRTLAVPASRTPEGAYPSRIRGVSGE